MSDRRALTSRFRDIWTPAALLLLLPAAASAATLSSVTINPRTVVNGSVLEVTVALDTPAPPGGVQVALSSSPAGIVTGPTLPTVIAGATSRSIVMDTGAVTASTDVTIEASYLGVIRSATVTVTPRVPVRGVAGDLWADVILGKPDFGEVTLNQVSGKRVFNPGGVLVDRSVRPNRVYVYDAGNSRVLGLDHLGHCPAGTNNGQPCTANSDCPGSTCAIEEGRDADLVLGQPSLTRSACNGDGNFQTYPQRAPAGASTLCTITESQISLAEGGSFVTMDVDGAGNFYVIDWDNNRVLRYNSPFTTDTVADAVWGQADFAGNSCNRGRGPGSPDNQSLCFRTQFNDGGFAGGVAIDSAGNLWVTDSANHRTLRFPYNSGTGLPAQAADLVLGQPDFASSAHGSAMNQMWSPAAARVDGAGAVYVADSANNRVLIFSAPISTGQTAGGKLNYAFNSPRGLELDPAGGIWVNDTVNNQILLFVGGAVQKVLFRDLPGSSGQGVTGDGPNFFYEGNGFFNSWSLANSGGSFGIDIDGSVLATSWEAQDVWRFPAPIPAMTPGIAHSADARVFKNFQWGISNEVGLEGLASGQGVVVAANQLIVSDPGRILFWNNPPNFTNGQIADGFVGQSDPRLLNAPHFGRIRQDGGSRLWTIRADKILAYALPLHTGDTPILTIASPLPVLGGGSLTWDGSLSVGDIVPVGSGDKVWIVDQYHNRVFRIRNALISPVADIVIGQANAAGAACNQGRGSNSPSRTSLCNPGSGQLDPQGNLYVSDHGLEVAGNFRLLRFDAALFPDSPTRAVFAIPASRVFGTGGSFTETGCKGDALELCTAVWQPAFKPSGEMVVGLNPYVVRPFPFVYTNPLVSQHVSTFLNDYYSMSFASTFDSNHNLYVTDLNRARVLIYLDPLSSPPPVTRVLTVAKTGSGTGTVTSTPAGIDCGAACSQPYIDGAFVTLSTTNGTGSLFAGWSGDADCADGVVTMSAAKTCTARFDLLPDLIVFALTAPATALSGSTISVTDTTRSQTGTGPAGASTTRFYFSTNSTWDAGDTPIGSRPVPALLSGGTSSGPSSVTIPAGKATGNYYIIAKADADLAVAESLETNNTKAVVIRISPPDLIVSAISVPTAGGAGLPIIATNTTKNQANTGPAPASTTNFYLSANAAWDGGDPQIGTQAIGALAAGASEAHSTSLTIPPTTTPGTWYVIAKADADLLITETIETNNASFDTIMIGPDLIESALSVPATGGAGLPIIINDTTKNQGAGQAAASTTNFYLSTNTTYGAGDVFLGSRSIGPLNPGATSAGQTPVTIPAGTAVGSYYILAVADGGVAVAETSEANNTLAALIKLSPDLLVSVLSSPASAAAGATITVADTTKNQGQGVAAETTTSFYLSANNTWDVGDTLLASRAVPILASGATSPGSTPVTIPVGTAPGNYFILARADATGAVVETSETNNVLSKAITITP